MGVDQMSRDSAGPELPADAEGRRVSCDGELATVRYLGSVPPTTGLWLGVEWDKPERGKHDGSHDGVQYFTCRHPTGGSFLRPGKVSFGVDFVTAVREQYKFDVQEVLREKHCVSSRTVEWANLEKLRFENQWSVISLSKCEVNGPGNENEIKEITGHVQSLDLSKNLLSCWDDVGTITGQMDQLEELLLSHNRLRLPSDPCAHSHSFSSLKVLILTSCTLTWPQILHCAPMWPWLEVLCVSQNNITELQRPVDVLQSLRSLDLSGNPLVEETVLSLSALPRLETLNLSEAGLSVLRFDDVPPGGQTAMFPSLKTLILDNNNITEWWVVDELNKLQSLVELSCRCKGLISSDGKPQTTHQLFIAKLKQLELLNRLKILPEDRRGAELDYIKMFGEEWLKAGGHPDPQQSRPSTQFTSQHPQYLSLIHKYGAPEEGELKKQQPFALKNQLIKVTFVFPDEADRKPIEKKLPVSMVVQKVKGLLYRLLKVPAADLKLTYTSSKLEGKEIEIDSDLKPLGFFSIEDGDEVLVRWS